MPLTIQTKTLEIALIGLKRLIEQKAIGKPSGAPQSSVTAKISNDILKPSSKKYVTSKNDMNILRVYVLLLVSEIGNSGILNTVFLSDFSNSAVGS